MNYIIIGAVAGGASTAARLRRVDEKANIILFEKTDFISYANCGLPYYIGDVIKDRNKLFVQTAASFKKRFAIDVRIKTEITAIDRVNKTVTATNLVTGKTPSNMISWCFRPEQNPFVRHFPALMKKEFLHFAMLLILIISGHTFRNFHLGKQ